MAKITVERTFDELNCETCGFSYAEGANILFEDGKRIELKAVAHCYDGSSYDDKDIMREILHHLGHELVIY